VELVRAWLRWAVAWLRAAAGWQQSAARDTHSSQHQLTGTSPCYIHQPVLQKQATASGKGVTFATAAGSAFASC
jgi:hypothetical protein